MNKFHVGVLISGYGSNMEAIVRSSMRRDSPVEVSCVISNNSKAPGMEIAKSYGIETFLVCGRPLDTDRVDEILRKHKVDLVCLAGFMSIISAQFVTAWHHKIINIHPSLLPSFKGLAAQKQALEAGVKVAGCTVHYVYPEVDGGPIVMQAAVPVLSGDSVASLSNRILQMEHKCYPKAVELIALNKIRVENGIVHSDETLTFFQ